MAVLYCEPKWRTFGLVEPGWRGFGGLLTDPKTAQYIPQYNLGAFWKRRIAPTVVGFVEPVLNPSVMRTSLHRPPGHFRFDQHSSTVENRNLIAARQCGKKKISLWVVSERSDRKKLEEYRAKVDEDGLVTSDGNLRNEYMFEEPITELKNSGIENMDVWTRSRRQLSLVNMENWNVHAVFRGAVRVFEENPYLAGDISLCDMGGMVWSGTVGQSMTRTKNACGDALKLVTHSDHPRILFGASDYHVRTVDLRADNSCTSTMLFTVPEFEKKNSLDMAVYIPEESYTRPKISHIQSVTDFLHSYIIMTNHSFFLCDDRFPTYPVITLPHSLPEGANFMLTSAPVSDPSGGGSIVSTYFLDHFLSGVSVSRLFIHDSEIWSSIEPIYSLGECSDIKKLVRPLVTWKVERLSEPVRGLAVVQFSKKRKRPMDILLRSLDDGSVWYETMRYGDISSVEEKLLWSESKRRMDKYLEERIDEESEYMKEFPLSLRQKPKALCTLIDVEANLDRLNLTEKVRPMNRTIDRKATSLERLEPCHQEAVLSNVILSTWRATAERALQSYSDITMNTTI